MEYLYVLTRAEMIEKLRKEQAAKGVEFIGSRAYTDLENGFGMHVELFDDTATLLIRVPEGTSAQTVEALARQFFAEGHQRIPAEPRDDGCTHWAFTGKRPCNPWPKSR